MATKDTITPCPHEDHENPPAEKARKNTLGNVRLRHHETSEIILIPTPSASPNDPLRWSQCKKYYVAGLICLAMVMCNFLAAGPSIAILETTLEFFPSPPPQVDRMGFVQNVGKIAYFFTTAALMQGVGNFVWVPLANKFGRRPVYICSYLVYLAASVWLIFEKTYGGFLAGRVILGFGAGAAETIAPITIADIFFLHERGTIMALYTSFLCIGVSVGIIISGLITIHHRWRVIYEVASALVAFVLLLAFLTFPETAFPREATVLPRVVAEKPLDAERSVSDPETASSGRPTAHPEQKRSFVESLRLFNGTLTRESFLKLFLRPLGLICLPPILWAALVQAVTIGFLVAVSSNVNLAFETSYHFKPYQIGLCFVSAIVGSVLGIFAGGHFSDWVADCLTKRNGGIRDPEMRLPAMIPCLIAAPLALLLYGIGIQHEVHWICPTVGLGLLNFAITQGTNVCLVYVIDGYRPVAGEVTLAVMGFKSIFGFVLSFYTNPWIGQAGYQDAYGAMAGISATMIMMWVPLYIWGKQIRHATWNWRVVSYIHWSDDREVGE